jgi:hypothetical protein
VPASCRQSPRRTASAQRDTSLRTDRYRSARRVIRFRRIGRAFQPI